jgi:phage gp36-like protein
MPAPTPYVDLPGFRARTLIDGPDVDLFESRNPGFIVQNLADWQSEIDSRLRKRYAVPFAAPPPAIIIRWLVRLTTWDVWQKRGTNPQDPAIEKAEKAHDLALTQLKEAADSEEGLYDLPLLETDQRSAVVNGGPLGYAEQSPYTWTTIEAQDASREDGSSGRPPTG